MSDLKDTDFGSIASDWNYIPSLKFCSKITDGTHDSPKQQKAGKHLVTSKHIKGRNIDFETAYLISEKDFDNINLRSKVEQWDVIVSMIGEYCGFTYVERNESIDYAVKNVGLFKTGSEHKALWLFYYLNSKIGLHILEINKSGTSQPYLTLGFLRELPILYPSSIDEANHIVQILSSLDDKIDLLNRQIKTLEQLAETLFRQWFVEEPEDSWEVGTLDDEFDFIMGQSPLGSELNEDKIGKIFYQGRSDFGFRFPTPRVYTTAPTRLAKPLDTLVSVRAPVGDMNIAFEECCLGRGVAAFRYKNNSKFYSYTYYKLRSLIEPIKQFEDNGSVFGSIGKDDFKKLENIIPPFKLIEDYQKEAKPIDDKILLNEHQIRTLTQTRDTLLPKLMSGEVRVNL
jgi:type I restriction enzyme S subunit